MNSTQLLETFRTEVSDAVAPYFWSDAEIYGYADDAQIWFCRLTDGIADSRTPTVTRLNIVPGVDWYDTSPLIRQVRKATRADTGRPVKLYTAEQADTAGIYFSTSRTGALHGLVLGLDAHTARATPMPDASYGLTRVSTGQTTVGTALVPFTNTYSIDLGMGVTGLGVPVGTVVQSIAVDTSIALSANVTETLPLGTSFAFGMVVNLSVYRLPLVTITEDGDQELEIDPQHHVALLHWMKHRAYDKQDAETFDRRKSDDFKSRFEAYCFRAQQEQQRNRRVHGNVAYGGM